MKWKKALSSVLASAMLVTSLYCPAVIGNAAENSDDVQVQSLEDGLVASYSFEGNLKNGVAGGDDAVPYLVKAVDQYTGDIVYVDNGKTGKAVRTDGYGLLADKGDIGKDYTVSAWVKMETNFEKADQTVMFLGYDKPEKWLGIASNGTEVNARLWTHDNNQYKWNSLNGSFDLPKESWHHIVLAGTDGQLNAYLDGKEIYSGGVVNALEDANQKIFLGVTYWDADKTFPGLYDEVKIYNRKLSTDEIMKLYDTRSASEVLNEDGFEVTKSLTIGKEQSRNLTVTLPAIVEAANPDISYISEKPEIATVDENGVVTGVAVGKTKITTTVTLTEKAAVAVSRSTEVEITDQTAVDDRYAAYYNMNEADGMLLDVSGHNADAEIVNPDHVEFIGQPGVNGQTMVFQNNQSYVKLPKSIIDNLTDTEQFSIEVEYSRDPNCGGTSWLWSLGSKVQGTGTNYLFFCPKFNGGAMRAGMKNSSSEKLMTLNGTLNDDQFYTATMVFNKGVIDLYVDGLKISSLNTGYSMANDILASGLDGDVLGFIGKSCWSPDPNFTGSYKSFKIYDKAMTETEVQSVDKDKYQKILQDQLESGVTVKSLLGKNADADNVIHDLALPAALGDLKIEWKSSASGVISDAGVVTSSLTEDKKATMTGKITSGSITAEVKFTFTVKKMNKDALNALIAEAEKVDLTFCTEVSAERLTKVLEEVKKADTNSVDRAAAAMDKLQKAMDALEFQELYMNPWDEIEKAAPDASKTMNAGQSVKLFAIPDSVKNMVDVEYEVMDPSVATYEDGTVKALKEGKTTVTATVTAKYDGWQMEYSTALEVETGKTMDFQDVKDTDWYYNEVLYVFNNNIMTGIRDDYFGAADVLSRAQFATTLYRMAGRPEVEYTDKFPDVPDNTFYTKPVLWASSKDIIKGYAEGTFGPDDNITREQIAVMMYRYAKFKGLNTSAKGDLTTFPDGSDVSEFGEEAMIWAVGAGLISGNKDGTLAPQGTTSRAVCATILMRFLENCK